MSILHLKKKVFFTLNYVFCQEHRVYRRGPGAGQTVLQINGKFEFTNEKTDNFKFVYERKRLLANDIC